MAQPPRSEHIQRVDANGRGLFVRTVWTIDRFRHRIGWVLDGAEYAALESCEGAPDDDWPPSPPMQQFATQTIDGNPTLLGIGMAGRGHWSATYVLRYNGFVELTVELACLVPLIPVGQFARREIPASTYRVIQPCRMKHVAASCALQSIPLKRDGLPDLIVRLIPGTSQLGMAAAVDRQLVIEPVMNHISKTTQWSYRIDTSQSDALPDPTRV